MGFSGIRVISLESRRASEMDALIRRHDGHPFVAPSVKEKAVQNNAEVLAWAERLFAGEFEMLVLMTGVGDASAALPVLSPDQADADAICLIQSFYAFLLRLAQARGADVDRPPHLQKVTRTR